jgi:hypothetical protein
VGPTRQLEREERGRTPSGFGDAGPQALSGTGPNGSHSTLFSFLISFQFFLISVFIFYLLLYSFNSIQTKT